ncbi:MAG: ParB N-terminal domain-containing protein [Acidipila sp.]|nr:ParB N-terminal domain-containing protein [Acidipila sp.]
MASKLLGVEYRPLASVRFDPQNPRVHTKKQVRQIATSIKAFGFNVPVLIDGQGLLIAGHGRLLAAQQLEMSHIPTITVEHLDEAQIRAFKIADNRLTEVAVWDDVLLAEQLQILSKLDLDFTVEVTGFEMSEIDMLIENLPHASPSRPDPADEIHNSASKPQVARTGDLWLLDRHRVCCGDGRDEFSYSLLMNGQRANMVITDPPYNDPIDKYVTGFGKIHHPEFAMASGELTEIEFTNFLRSALARLANNSLDGALHFIFIDWRHSGELLSAARSVYSEFKNLCVWVKNSGGQGSLYRSQHELIFVFKNGKKPHRNNIQLGQYGRYRTNVWEYPSVRSLSRNTEDGKLTDLHPTVKPVELIADAILDCTARGDVVLDAFLGSGTTVIAAERTGRVCFGIELNPRYVDVIMRRWQSFTGQDAVLLSTKQTFNEIEEANRGAGK